MKHSLSPYNWSLSRLLATEPDSLTRARICILYTIVVFSLVKLAIALPVGYLYNQDLQLIRSASLLVIFVVMLKLLLADRKYATRLGVTMIWMGLFLTWSNVFITAQTINIVTVQTVVMIILSSFYLFNWRWALMYSFMSVMPVVMLLILGQNVRITNIAPAQLASPAYEIIVVLNFLTIVITHFLYYQALHRNVVEKEALNVQLQMALKEANQATQSKADFLSTMSHELRTPLNSVIGMSQLLLNPMNDYDRTENVKILNFSATNLHMLINDILDFNKMESDKLSLEKIDVDLNKLVNDISSGMRFQAQEKGLELNVRIDESVRLNKVVTDPTRVTQIIHNLISNAIKFTPIGRVDLELDSIEKNAQSMTVRFSVSDTGIGVNDEQKKIIFDPFTQASSSTTRIFGGTGLGLAIVKRLLYLFESDIQVESEVGQGSQFRFTVTFDLAGNSAQTSSTVVKQEYDLSHLRVLVVEDNPINSLLLKKIFSNWNNVPDFAGNGYEALDKLKDNTYNVILMDIHMPLLDGYEATRMIRKIKDRSKASVPIIALTASVSNDLNNKIKEAGMNDFINKPFNFEELYSKLIALCAKEVAVWG